MRKLPVRSPLALLLALASAAAVAQTGGPRPGEDAPPITVGTLFQAPASAGADLPSLRGNVVVLEFWATWCAPCIAAMPHMNELAKVYRDRPVRFVSVSDEPAETVSRFLKKGLLKTWVVADPSGATHQAYGVQTIPRTLILDRAGKVLAVVRPEAVTRELLDRALRGEPLETASPATPAPKKEPPKAGPPLYRFDLRPTDRPSNSSRVGLRVGLVQIQSARLVDILQIVLDITPLRLVVQGKLPEGTYGLDAKLPPSLEGSTSAFVSRRLEECFGIEIRKEKRRLPVYVLTAPKGPGPEMKPMAEFQGHSSGPGVFVSKAASLSTIQGFLENNLARPVIDETKLTGPYAYSLIFKFGDPSDLRRALSELGLVLTEETREIEVYVVSALRA